jgi:hypothetical protein
MSPVRRTQNRRWVKPSGRSAVALAALLLLALQAFIVQTHIHVLAPQSHAGIEQLAGASDDGVAHLSATHAQSGCAICDLLASTGRAIVPAPALLAFEAEGFLDQAPPAIRAAPRALTHAWQSRAPPIAL